jgi:glycosyltransferase involved in cell wall biosynthesis
MTQADNPLVSMIVLCYNQARFVVETLESVKAQTYKPTELIILDDCSSDDSVTVIENWLQENGIECTFIRHQKNQGICKSLNEALSFATGKYISEISSDDVWLPDKIARQVEIMESQPDEVGVVYSDAFQIDDHGQILPETLITSCRRLTEMPQGQILRSLLEGNFIGGQTTLVRRSCYDKVGLYDENLPWEDWDMWLRIARHYSFIYSPMPSAKYRIHDESYSHSDPIRMLRDSCKISLKQLALGGLGPVQKSEHTERLLRMSERLYSENDDHASDLLSALWQATGNRRAWWMYRFAKAGVSFRNFQRVDICRARVSRLRNMFRKVNGIGDDKTA